MRRYFNCKIAWERMILDRDDFNRSQVRWRATEPPEIFFIGYLESFKCFKVVLFQLGKSHRKEIGGNLGERSSNWNLFQFLGYGMCAFGVCVI
jgi:hypothetical protein